ncbi:MAG: LacI family DNA-binding transcriptional regulator [Victivallaceae bacterium]|nr:LacI family DNA-binding transcriptional regulator [Victivallaceae bacterium]
MGKHKITLADIAAAVGCSKATVSYALTRTRSISEPMRKQILQAAERLHYQPSENRRLKNQRKIIALIMRGNRPMTNDSDLRDAFNQEVLDRGYIPQFFFFPDLNDSVKTILAGIASQHEIAGIINFLPELESLDLLRCSKQIPSVIYARENCMLSPVRPQYSLRMQIALNELVRHGHRNIFFLVDSATEKKAAMQKNLQDIRQFCIRHQNQVRVSLVWHPEERDKDALFPKLDAARQEGHTAAITWNGFLTTMFYQWAYQRGLRIPDDISVIGFEDSAFADGMAPELTTVSLAQKALAFYTVDTLLRKINGEKEQEFLIPPQLQMRNSVAAPAE